MADKWYNSEFGKGLGLAAMIFAAGFALATLARGCRDYECPRQNDVEIQRLKTIEALTEKYGDKFSPEDLSKLLENNDLKGSYKTDN